MMSIWTLCNKLSWTPWPSKTPRRGRLSLLAGAPARADVKQVLNHKMQIPTGHIRTRDLRKAASLSLTLSRSLALSLSLSLSAQ